jgi:hypothetical protein
VTARCAAVSVRAVALVIACAVGLCVSAPAAWATGDGLRAHAVCTTCVLEIVFTGSGSATKTTTDQAGGSSSDTDAFSWKAVYDFPLADLVDDSLQSGWNSTDVAENYASSTFTGTVSASCTPPSGGSCVEPGGGTSCSGSFANNNSVPLDLHIDYPPANDVWTMAAPAFGGAQSSSSCYPTAITDTCDPLWSSPFPGSGENSPVTGLFMLDSSDPEGSSPATASRTWNCTSSNGSSTDSGSIQWTGTVTRTCLSGTQKCLPAGGGMGTACRAPNLRGKTLSQIKTSLTHAGCKLGRVTRHHSHKVPKGHEISQNPAAGRVVPSGIVNVVLSKGR